MQEYFKIVCFISAISILVLLLPIFLKAQSKFLSTHTYTSIQLYIQIYSLIFRATASLTILAAGAWELQRTILTYSVLFQKSNKLISFLSLKTKYIWLSEINHRSRLHIASTKRKSRNNVENNHTARKVTKVFN